MPRRRALLLLPALAACYIYAPPRWGADPGRRYATRERARSQATAPRRAARSAPRPEEGYEVRPGARDEPSPPALAGAAARAVQPEEPPTPPDVGEVRGRIVEAARRFLGQPFAGDCSGFVRRVLRDADVDVGPLPSAHSMSESLHLACRTVRRPLPGDLVFFHDTYDRNRDGKLGDPWTHVALVEAVEGDQVWILHRGGRGISRLLMNLSQPHDRTLNDPVRVRTAHDPEGTRYLAAELFSAYGAVVE